MNTKPSASLYNDTHQDNQNNTNKYFPLLAIGFALLGWFMALGTSKTQFVRFIDVALYGPYLTYIAFQENYTFSIIEKIFLLFLGITTITYNARNMLKIN